MNKLYLAIITVLIIVAAFYGYTYWKKHHEKGGVCPCGCASGCQCAADCKCRQEGGPCQKA